MIVKKFQTFDHAHPWQNHLEMWNTLQHWSIIFNLVFLVLPWERKCDDTVGDLKNFTFATMWLISIPFPWEGRENSEMRRGKLLLNSKMVIMVVTTIFVESRNLQTPKPPSRKWNFLLKTPFFGCCCHNNLAECLECKYGYSTQKFQWWWWSTGF